MPDLKTLIAQAWASVTQPREAARWVMSFDMPRLARWEVLLLVVALSVIAAHISIVWLIGPGPEAGMMAPLLQYPWTTAIIQMSILVISVFAVFWIGRAMGGTGGFGDAILLVAWLQFCLLCLQVVQTAVMLVFPPLAGLIGLAGVGLFFWLLTNFVAELHGFQSLGQVFLMVIVSILGIVFALSLILTLIGITVPGAPGNV
ncbi:Yip1 family protein [Psychromarinibacter sediminicola]|nr:Yip1 family protein [Psychromarinibacter sediminicola]